MNNTVKIVIQTFLVLIILIAHSSKIPLGLSVDLSVFPKKNEGKW